VKGAQGGSRPNPGGFMKGVYVPTSFALIQSQTPWYTMLWATGSEAHWHTHSLAPRMQRHRQTWRDYVHV